ncbi:MAG: NAD(P)H-hydrate dehydratase [Clostridia bacterium]|nr:NAD(P)H-hydrate dehydratase [Clostridia bacterium]
MFILNAEKSRIAELEAAKRGIGLTELMERAGRSSFEIIEKFNSPENKKTVIVCGKGNNGGDGFVIARHMLAKGYDVKVILALGQPAADDAKLMMERIDGGFIEEYDENARETIMSADIIVDCIFGLGLSGAVRKPAEEVIGVINRSRARIFSIDVPSGMSSDSGMLAGACVRAHCTITFSSLKPCHVIFPARQLCSSVVVADIGIAPDIIARLAVMRTADDGFVKTMLPRRFADSNKGSYGKLMSICGSMRMVGAAALSGMAAMRCGLGLLCCALPGPATAVLSHHLIEAVMLPLPVNQSGNTSKSSLPMIYVEMEKSSACLIGCGLGLDNDTRAIVYDIVQNAKIPLIIDADGINALALNKDILKQRQCEVVLTPHPGEMARLCSTDAQTIQSRRLEYATGLAREYGVTVVLKGANTIITDGRRTFVNMTGNDGMAKGGSGDVLAGMIASLAAQGMEPFYAAVCAVYLHGLGGDIAAKNLSRRAMLPTDIVNALPAIFAGFEKQDAPVAPKDLKQTANNA